MANWSGGATGAAGGAAAGSAFGPWGTGIGAGIGGLLGLFGGNSSWEDMPPEAERYLKLHQQRFEGQTPLYESVARLAFDRLPTNARSGIDAPSLATAEGQTSPLSEYSGDMPDALRNLFRQGEVRYHLSDPLMRAIQQLVGLRLPMGFQVPYTPPTGSNEEYESRRDDPYT